MVCLCHCCQELQFWKTARFFLKTKTKCSRPRPMRWCIVKPLIENKVTWLVLTNHSPISSAQPITRTLHQQDHSAGALLLLDGCYFPSRTDKIMYMTLTLSLLTLTWTLILTITIHLGRTENSLEQIQLLDVVLQWEQIVVTAIADFQCSATYWAKCFFFNKKFRLYKTKLNCKP